MGISGRYKELANTSWPDVNVGVTRNEAEVGNRADQISEVPIPPDGVVVLKREN